MHTSLPACSRTLILATAVPKGDRFRWLIEKATELGVTRLVPLHTERPCAPRESKLDKQQQYVIEACKQSGRNTLLEFVPQQSSPNSSTPCHHYPAAWSAIHGHDERLELRSALHANQGEIALLVGRGGFSPQEEQQLQERGVLSVSVAPHILRTETAGLLLAGVVAYLAAPPP
ncbi:MAG: RsmE family RNA methyltransferase [Planctomycetaceae bacterium]